MRTTQIDSVMIVLTFTLNQFLMLDITELRHAKPMRFTALVDQRLKNQFTAYESLFDAVYYVHW